MAMRQLTDEEARARIKDMIFESQLSFSEQGPADLRVYRDRLRGSRYIRIKLRGGTKPKYAYFV
jgi:hypothetical protein